MLAAVGEPDCALRVRVARAFRLEQAAVAHQFGESGRTGGPRVIQTADVFATAESLVYLTDYNAGLYIAEFFAQRGGEPLAVAGLQLLIRRMVAGADELSVRCTPHVLRHTFARNFLTNGDDDLREAHRRASPVDRLGLR